MKHDEFDPLDETELDLGADMTVEQINQAIDQERGADRPPADPEESAEAPPARQDVQEDASGDIFDGLDLDDVLGRPSAQEAAQEPAAAPAAPAPSKLEQDIAYLREQNNNQVEQNRKLAETILALQNRMLAQGDEPAPSQRTIDDIDEGNRDYFEPLYRDGMEAKRKLAEIEPMLNDLAPLVEQARQAKYGQYLEGAVTGFKADQMPAFMAWVNTLPEDVRARYGSAEAGTFGAEVLAERFLRTRGGSGAGAQPRVSPMASRAASDMGGDALQRSDKRQVSYDQLMDLDDEKWEKVAARLEAGM